MAIIEIENIIIIPNLVIFSKIIDSLSKLRTTVKAVPITKKPTIATIHSETDSDKFIYYSSPFFFEKFHDLFVSFLYVSFFISFISTRKELFVGVTMTL